MDHTTGGPKDPQAPSSPYELQYVPLKSVRFQTLKNDKFKKS